MSQRLTSHSPQAGDTRETSAPWLGPRWNEALGLRVCDLNPLRHELTLGRVVVNQNGSRTFTERLSKTEDARTVPVPAPVMDASQEHLAVYCAGGCGPTSAATCSAPRWCERVSATAASPG